MEEIKAEAEFVFDSRGLKHFKSYSSAQRGEPCWTVTYTALCVSAWSN